MTVSVVSRVTINANREEVFKYLGDSSFHFLWNPHLQILEPMGKLKEGSKYNTTSLLLGVKVSGRNTVTKMVSNREMQIENSAGAIKYSVNYQLKSNSKPTQVTCTTKVSTEGRAFAFSAPLLRMLARRELQSDLKSLKIAVENDLS